MIGGRAGGLRRVRSRGRGRSSDTTTRRETPHRRGSRSAARHRRWGTPTGAVERSLLERRTARGGGGRRDVRSMPSSCLAAATAGAPPKSGSTPSFICVKVTYTPGTFVTVVRPRRSPAARPPARGFESCIRYVLQAGQLDRVGCRHVVGTVVRIDVHLEGHRFRSDGRYPRAGDGAVFDGLVRQLESRDLSGDHRADRLARWEARQHGVDRERAFPARTLLRGGLLVHGSGAGAGVSVGGSRSGGGARCEQSGAASECEDSEESRQGARGQHGGGLQTAACAPNVIHTTVRWPQMLAPEIPPRGMLGGGTEHT